MTDVGAITTRRTRAGRGKSERTFQHRIRREFVRLQARLEAGTGDRWIPLLAALLLSLLLTLLSVARLRGVEGGIDLAGYAQALWLLGEGKLPQASLFGDGVHLLGVHWSFIVYPLALPASLATTTTVLVVSQSIALGLGVVPLWRLARRVAHLRIGASAALVLAYSVYPAVHELALDDFHPEAFAVPGLIAMAYLGAIENWVGYWATVGVVLACRADLGIAVALWGFVLLSEGKRRAGLWTMGVGTVWALGLLLVVQPVLSGPVVSQYGSYGDSLGEAILQMVTNPIDLLGDLTSQSNVSLLIGLLAPVIFLPLLSLRHLAPALPLGALYLVTADDTTAFSERYGLLTAFVFIASTFALARLGDMGVDRVFVDIRLLLSLIAASTLLFINDAPSSPYAEPWNWAELDATDVAIKEAAALLTSDDAVRTTPSGAVELAERSWLHVLDTSQQPQVLSAVYQVRAVLIVEKDLPPLPEDDRLAQRDSFGAGMSSQGYELIYSDLDDGVLLYYRP